MSASKIEDLLEVADSAMTASHIATEAPLALSPELRAAEALEWLQGLGFDCAVLEESPVERFVTGAALADCESDTLVSAAAKPITTRELIYGLLATLHG